MSQASMWSERRKANRGAITASATGRVLEQTDRLLGAGESVKVVVINPNNDQPLDITVPPAWTDGKTITINGMTNPMWKAFREGMDPHALSVISGLNYHELAHCFFTPRVTSELAKKVQSVGAWGSFNILEDQLAETRFVLMYGPARHYFTKVAVEYFRKTQQQTITNYVLVIERRFLPLELRQYLRDNFARQDLIQELEDLTESYLLCVYPQDQDRMLDIIKRHHELLKQLEASVGHQVGQSPSQHDHQGDEALTEGQTLTEEEQEELNKRLDEVGEQTEEGEEGSDEALGEDGEEDGEGDGEGEKGKKGKGDKEGKSKSGEKSDPSPRRDNLAGYSEGKSKKEQSLEDILTDVEHKTMDALERELRVRGEAVKSQERNYEVQGHQGQFSTGSPSGKLNNTAKKVERVFRRLQDKYRPGWHLRKPTGKLNPNDLTRIKRGELDVFKRWFEGVHNVMDYEICILVDQSGSMHGDKIREASESLWVLHKALKGVGAEVTVLGFSDSGSCHLLQQRREPTPSEVRYYHAGGSTWVTPALHESERIFEASTRQLKLLIPITDGGFSDAQQVDTWLGKECKVHTAMVGIGSDVSRWGPDRYKWVKLARTIDGVHELVPFIRDLVVSMADENASRRSNTLTR